MLRFRNSSRRFTRTTSRSKFASKRNFRAADGGMYVIENVEKMV